MSSAEHTAEYHTKASRIMPFWDHVYELRRRMFVVLLSVALFSVGGYYAFPPLVEMVTEIVNEGLYATSITEGFVTRLKVAVLIGAACSVPLFTAELLLFVAPAMRTRQKFWATLTVVVAFIVFVGGFLFAFEKVLPISVAFLKSETFFPGNVNRLISYGLFLNFFFRFLFGFGLFFEFPVVMIVLLKLGIIDRAFLKRNFKYFIGLIFLLAAIITPPDLVSQVLLATPMVVLYVVMLAVAKLFRIG